MLKLVYAKKSLSPSEIHNTGIENTCRMLYNLYKERFLLDIPISKNPTLAKLSRAVNLIGQNPKESTFSPYPPPLLN